MKILLSLSLFLCSLGLFAQSYDSLGLDNNPVLNLSEVNLLNTLLDDTREDFDFSNKKVAFITGPSGQQIIEKSEYFQNIVAPRIGESMEFQIFMVKLSEEEKIQSGGYDVLVLSWVKVFSSRTQKKTIEQLGKNQST